MFGPLNFPVESSEPSVRTAPPSDEDTEEAVCILCPNRCPSYNELLTHFFVEHKLVIGDVPLISDLKLYLDFWRVKLAQVQMTDVCTGIQMNGELYYLLSDVLPEDRALREGLHIKRMEAALTQQAWERSDITYNTHCMFCRHEMGPTRAVYIQHLAEHHNVQLGAAQTLVYIDRLLAAVQRQVDNLKCLFCERTYKSRDVLKEHMRKKGHKRLNPHNEMYDQFYIDSYREMNAKKSKWQRPSTSSHSSCSSTSLEPSARSAGDASDEDDDVADSDWSDWAEEDSVKLVCLFCDVHKGAWSNILSHMREEHGFDFVASVAGLDFYQQVKLVNYLRREIYWNSCPVCREKFQTKPELYEHIKCNQHALLPDQSLWNCPEYFFPTYENDGFLYQLDDGDDESESDKIGAAQEIMPENVLFQESTRVIQASQEIKKLKEKPLSLTPIDRSSMFQNQNSTGESTSDSTLTVGQKLMNLKISQ